MFKKLLVILLTLFVIALAGYLALRRADIPYDTLEAAYANADSQFITVAGEAPIHLRDVGPRDAPAIVLIHGFSASLHTWEAWAEDLKADYRVISIDLPGHGLSRCPDVSAVGIPHFVDIVDRSVEALGVTGFTIGGNSMGGNTAWAYTLAHPEKVEGLVLVDASGWPDTGDDADGEPFVFKLLSNPIARNLMKGLDMSGLIRSGLEDSFTDQSLVTDEMVTRYASLNRAPCHRDAILALSSERSARTPASHDVLGVITAPTLILHGEDDNLVPVAHGRQFQAAITDAELVVYPDVGHIPQEEVPAQSVADLRNFLQARVYAENPPPAAPE